MTDLWSDKSPLNKTTEEFVKSITDNKDLQTLFCYNWGNYATIPSESAFSMQALLMNHFMRGSFYPGVSLSPLQFSSKIVVKSLMVDPMVYYFQLAERLKLLTTSCQLSRRVVERFWFVLRWRRSWSKEAKPSGFG